jgi:hypothetical protein
VAVLWAEASDENEESAETEAHGEVDETFASRRLRRWLTGMFGGGRRLPDPSERESDEA